jgi:hypothetical protein
MLGLWLGLVGFSLATGCVVKSGDDDDDDLGEAGDSSGGTSTGGRGGSATGGSSTGGSATGGSSTGGSATGGSSTGGSATGGSSTGGTGGMDTEYECDPESGDDLQNTPYPNCTAESGDECGQCLETNCCEESKICYGYNPGNVCGYGGIDYDDDGELDGEFNCFVACALDYVEDNDVLDEAGKDYCAGECVTAQCGSVIGTATNELISCAEDHCEDECWPAP